jgi:hypothetical protein
MQHPQYTWKIKEKTIAGPQNFNLDEFFTDSKLAQPPRTPVHVGVAYVGYIEDIKEEGYTVYAYSYATVGVFQICLVDHAHIVAWSADEFKNPWIAGHSYIPGLPGRDWKTPSSVVTWLQTTYQKDVVERFEKNPDLTQRTYHNLVGTFPPGNDRYPKQL